MTSENELKMLDAIADIVEKASQAQEEAIDAGDVELATLRFFALLGTVSAYQAAERAYWDRESQIEGGTLNMVEYTGTPEEQQEQAEQEDRQYERYLDELAQRQYDEVNKHITDRKEEEL